MSGRALDKWGYVFVDSVGGSVMSEMWWTISNTALSAALKRVEGGESADEVLMAIYLESEHHEYGESE